MARGSKQSKATVQTLADSNKLLRFAKEHSDVGLIYDKIGPPSELSLVCFFDAAFATRGDGSSQAGYVLMLSCTRAS